MEYCDNGCLNVQWCESGHENLVELPLELKLDFLIGLSAFMFDVEHCIGRNQNPLTGDLDLKTLALLQAVGQSSQHIQASASVNLFYL